GRELRGFERRRSFAGHPRPGPDRGRPRALRHPNTRRLGRGGHQGGNAGGRPRAGFRRPQAPRDGVGLPRREPQQALALPRLENAGGGGGAAAARPPRGRARHQCPPGRHGAAGLRLGSMRCAQPEARLRRGDRLRPGRPAPRATGLRRGDPGGERLGRRGGRGRPARLRPLPGRGQDHRHGAAVGRARRPAPPGAHGRRPARGGADAGNARRLRGGRAPGRRRVRTAGRAAGLRAAAAAQAGRHRGRPHHPPALHRRALAGLLRGGRAAGAGGAARDGRRRDAQRQHRRGVRRRGRHRPRAHHGRVAGSVRTARHPGHGLLHAGEPAGAPAPRGRGHVPGFGAPDGRGAARGAPADPLRRDSGKRPPPRATPRRAHGRGVGGVGLRRGCRARHGGSRRRRPRRGL
ncbi:MAG: Alpha-methylacyl-CoA racemase, partial [uncultured Acetobacteraceae bacterium]